jgi:hypothetical protein
MMMKKDRPEPPAKHLDLRVLSSSRSGPGTLDAEAVVFRHTDRMKLHVTGRATRALPGRHSRVRAVNIVKALEIELETAELEEHGEE